MNSFDWFTNVIVPSCLTAIFALLAFLRNKIWFLFIQLSDKRIAKKIPEFQEFIRKVMVKEANSKNIFSNESREFSEKNVIKFARFKIKVENSDLILFDKILHPTPPFLIHIFFYNLQLVIIFFDYN